MLSGEIALRNNLYYYQTIGFLNIVLQTVFVHEGVMRSCEITLIKNHNYYYYLDYLLM